MVVKGLLRKKRTGTKKTISSMLAALLILPLLMPAIAVAAPIAPAGEEVVIDTPLDEDAEPEADDPNPGDDNPSLQPEAPAEAGGNIDAPEDPAIADEDAGSEEPETESGDAPPPTESDEDPAGQPTDEQAPAYQDETTTIEQASEDTSTEPEPAAVDNDGDYRDEIELSADLKPIPIASKTQGPVTVESLILADEPMTGAIWTTDPDGDTVNANHYANKTDVYLNGGPQKGSGPLPEGDYYWQVTNPDGNVRLGWSGQKLVSVDASGTFSGIPLYNWHPPEDPSLSEYDDTPNPGGTYKVWLSKNPAFPSDESSTDTFHVQRNPGIDISKTDSVDPIVLDQTTVYTISVETTRNMDLTDVTVTDTLPDWLDYVAGSGSPVPTSIADSSKTLTWNLGSMQIHEVKEITFEVRGTKSGTWTNNASVEAIVAVTAQDRNPDEVNASTSEDTTVIKETIEITKDDVVDPVVEGKMIDYFLTVVNTGETTLTEVTVDDTLPSGLVYVGGSSSHDIIIDGNDAQHLTWNLGEMSPDEEIVVTFSVMATIKDIYDNVATVTTAQEVGDEDSERTVVLEPGVDITKSDDIDPIFQGNNTTYTITVTNSGETTLTDVAVTDTLPAGMSFVDSDVNDPDPDSVVGQTITWNLGTMLQGAVREIIFQASGDTTGTHWNNVVVDSSEDATAAAKEDTTVNPKIFGIDIVKDDRRNDYLVGETVIYDLKITNTGNQTLSPILVTDTLPAELAFEGSSPAPDASGTPAWTIASLDPGESTYITVFATALAAGDGPVTNTADAIADEASDTDDEDTNILDKDLEITKTDSVDPVILGQNTTYTITVENTGDVTLMNVIVTDTLPDGMEYISDDQGADVSGQELTWEFDYLGVGESIVINISVKANKKGLDQENRADVCADVVPFDQGEIRSVATDETPVFDDLFNICKETEEQTDVLEPGVDITKSDDVDPIFQGNNTTYTITVTNSGETTLTDVAVTDTLPAGMSFVDSDVNDPDPDSVVGQTITWNLGTMLQGAVREIIFQASGDTTGTHWNNVVVDSSEDATAAAKEDTTVNPKIFEVEIDKADTVDPITEGELTDYIITITNTGNQPLTGVTLLDQLPAAFEFDSASIDTQVVDGKMAWDLGTLDPDESAQVTVAARGMIFGTHTNVAEVDAKELDEPEQATEPTTVEVVAATAFGVDLQKVDDVDPANIGDTVTYTITVTNTGLDPLHNLVVTDSLPAGLEFLDADEGVEQTGDAEFTLTVDLLDPAEARSFRIMTTATRPGDWTNVAEVTADEIKTAVRAVEVTGVREPVAGIMVAAAVDEPAEEPAQESLPRTGFPVAIWWLTALAAIVSGLWIERSTRRRLIRTD